MVRRIVANRPDLDPALLELLAQDSDPAIRFSVVATHDDCPPETLRPALAVAAAHQRADQRPAEALAAQRHRTLRHGIAVAAAG